jgi:hypothetical protein
MRRTMRIDGRNFLDIFTVFTDYFHHESHEQHDISIVKRILGYRYIDRVGNNLELIRQNFNYFLSLTGLDQKPGCRSRQVQAYMGYLLSDQTSFIRDKLYQVIEDMVCTLYVAGSEFFLSPLHDPAYLDWFAKQPGQELFIQLNNEFTRLVPTKYDQETYFDAIKGKTSANSPEIFQLEQGETMTLKVFMNSHPEVLSFVLKNYADLGRLTDSYYNLRKEYAGRELIQFLNDDNHIGFLINLLGSWGVRLIEYWHLSINQFALYEINQHMGFSALARIKWFVLLAYTYHNQLTAPEKKSLDLWLALLPKELDVSHLGDFRLILLGSEEIRYFLERNLQRLNTLAAAYIAYRQHASSYQSVVNSSASLFCIKSDPSASLSNFTDDCLHSHPGLGL